MRRTRNRILRWLPLLLLSALLVGSAPPAQAQSTLEDRDYDLVTDNGLVLYSQIDRRWSQFFAGPAQTQTIADCGCLLAALSTVIHHQVSGLSPWFPTQLLDGGAAFDFNPRYLDVFFRTGPAGNSPPGWGYKTGLPANTCGIIPVAMALQSFGEFLGRPVGVYPVVHKGWNANIKRIVNQNLNAGRPTILMIKVGGATRANHVVLIAGWDADVDAYRTLDPMAPAAGINGPTRPQVPAAVTPTSPSSYENFEALIEGIIDIRPGTSTILPGILFGDDPSPIEILMTGPDGRRTGFDPQSGSSFEDNPGAIYWTFGPWTDPFGNVPQSEPPRFITYQNAPLGRYHFQVTGTADGPLDLSADVVFGTTRVPVGVFGGTIAAGEVRKYEFQFAGTQPSTIAQVTNFTPHAFAGDDLQARTDAAIAFDGGRSFDADGTIATYVWDFGDGSSDTGARPQHVYRVPGDYTVTLTVTDANGSTDVDSLRANVILSQRRPVAHASGPYLGFASPGPEWPVLLDARGSSDPNGDTLTYRWDFGDGSPTRTTTAPFVDHVYGAIGHYTMTVVANDGLEDSAPAVAAVEIVQAPSAPPFGTVDASLVPACGMPGETVTITMGEFAQFLWWNFDTMGPLPAFPPAGLPLGLSAPDGFMNLTLPGGERQYVPFSATLLGPGRYVAEASFIVPPLPPGRYSVGWAEADELRFRIPCREPDNHPPLADAGGPYTGGVGGDIAFDGSASSDPDGDELEYVWDFGDGTFGEGDRPSHAYARAGRYIVVLVVNDGLADSATAAGTRSFAAVTVTEDALDTIPPVTGLVASPPSLDGWHSADVTIDLHAVDNAGGSGVRQITFVASGAQPQRGTVPGDTAQLVVNVDGVTVIEYFATDNAGNQESPQQFTVRLDRSGPSIVGMPVEGCTLWPPNHTLRTVARISASDTGAGLSNLVVTASSSEPEDARGDGSTAPDVVISGGDVALRSERSGTGSGRVYTITATATDLAGNVSQQVAACTVPHDRGPVR